MRSVFERHRLPQVIRLVNRRERFSIYLGPRSFVAGAEMSFNTEQAYHELRWNRRGTFTTSVCRTDAVSQTIFRDFGMLPRSDVFTVRMAVMMTSHIFTLDGWGK